MTRGRNVGARVLRREDRRLLLGRGRYVDDLSPDGLKHVAFLRSDQAHARLITVDTAAAREVPGVLEVFTAVELAPLTTPLRVRSTAPGYSECDTPPLAVGKVRMVGEPVAMVVADSRYAAEDGVAAIDVAWEPLVPLLEIEDAMTPGAAAIHDEIPDNLFNHFETATEGIDRVFDEADHVIELELQQQRYGAVAMEGRAVVVEPGPDDHLTVWLSSQVPHLARTGLAEALAMPENKIRLISPDVGGGFGPKCVLYQEEVCLAAVARKLGRPLKWVSDRVEDLQTTVHGREQIHRVKAAANGDGRVRAVAVEIFASNGAYAPWPFGAGLDSGQASENVTGPYAIPHFSRRVHAVVTNKAPMGPYRGVGRVMACLSMERVMDEVAAKVGIDPLEVRRRNLVQTFPFDTPAGLRLDSGDYLRSLDLLADAIGWDAARKRARMPGAGSRYVGVGLACAVEHSAYGPQALGSRRMEITAGFDSSTVRVEPDGRVRVAVGLHSHGQGQETTMAQIVADQLGIEPGDIQIVFGDTDVVPYGTGTWASRSTVYCGGATILACREIREKVLAIAAEELEARPDDLEIVAGRIRVRGTSSPEIKFARVAKLAHHAPHLLPEGIEPGLECTRRYSAPDPGSFSSAMHAAEVEVDVDTGAVEVRRYVVVEDCGVIVNPTIVEGQIHGGVAQGIGGALHEHLVYDEAGQLVTSSLMDYLVPSSAEIPPIDVVHLETPSPYTLGGWKGMGEGGAINAPAAIVAAVNDALRPFGVRANHTPITPEWIVETARGSKTGKDLSFAS